MRKRIKWFWCYWNGTSVTLALAREYDIFKITAVSQTNVFESVIAPTLQNGFETVGGANQRLVLDRSLWSEAVKTETFLP